MNTKQTLLFVAGAAMGALAAWSVTKNKYENILKEEIQSVKDTYKNRKEMVVTESKTEVIEEVEEVEVKQETERDMREYAELLSKQGYTNYGKNNDDTPDEMIIVEDEPYVIDDEEYGEDGFDTQTITYYADGVFVDDVDDVISNPDVVFGAENINKAFTELQARRLLVRNETYMVDYEIIRDDWDYASLDQDIYPISEITEEHMLNGEKYKRPHEL